MAFPTPFVRGVFSDKQVYRAAGDAIPLSSNVSIEEATELYELVKAKRPTDSLETGFAQGISALSILQALADNAHGTHHVLDPFQERFEDVGLAMVSRARLEGRMRFYRKFAEEVIPTLPPLQFAFIDSSHLFDLTISEFVLVDKKLEVGGLLAMHDMWMPSLQKAVRYILSNRAYRLHPMRKASERSVGRQIRSGAKRLLKALPRAQRIFRQELIEPSPDWANLVVLEKTGKDDRDWRHHRLF